MLTIKRYPKYKPSGVEWLGEIPEHWEIRRLSSFGSFFKGSGISRSELTDKGCSAILYGDIYTKYDISVKNVFNKISEDISKKSTLIKKNDILFTGSGETVEDIGKSVVNLSDENVFVGGDVIVFRPVENNSLFLSYALNTNELRFQKSRFAKGEIVVHIYSSTLKNIFTPIPPLPEQKAIANFLDKKTSQIETLIQKKTEMIKLLKEEKSALINNAVTKGINPNVKMKDSGIEWIGEIPEHWEVIRLRYLGVCQNGISKSAEFFGKGYPFLSYSDVYKNTQIPLNLKGLIESNDNDRVNYSVEEGDVFFTRTSETIEEIGFASTCINTINDAVFAGFLIRFRPNNKNRLIKDFSKFYFRANIHRRYFVKEMNLVTRASLSQELLKKLPVLLPPLPEQQSIVTHIETETARIDTTITKIEKEIELIKEYKTALISEAVTGKIDVRTN